MERPHLKLLLLAVVYFVYVERITGQNSSDVPTVEDLPTINGGINYFFQGPPGKDGRDGRDGRDGKDGSCSREQSTGHPGQAGMTGPAGPIGLPGPMGHPGKVGPAGTRGQPGETGERGQAGPPGSPGLDAPPNPGSSGTVFTRWGRTTCPETADLIYEGAAGGTFFDESGGGSNYLCLPQTPEYDVFQSGRGRTGYRAYVYSAEYEIRDFPLFIAKNHYDVPCAVCRATNRGSMVMIPAMMHCPGGWIREYYGYMMTEGVYDSGSRQRKEFICVDKFLEGIPGGNGNENGALMVLVESRCDRGHLPCPPYEDGKEMTCVVCSR